MSKVNVNKREVKIPNEYFSNLKPGCESFEQILKVQPLITAFTATNVPYKIVVELPNVNFRLNEMFLEAAITGTMTSNNGGDSVATVLPAVVPYATSMINQARLIAGSTEVLNFRQVNTRYNWQQNMMTNSINRLEQQYNNLSPVNFNTTATQTFRFPLTALGSDFFSLQDGIWPGYHVKKCNLEIYWEAPQYCMYYQGTALGTITFGYSVSNFNLQVVAISDPNLDKMISTRGMILNYLEWYWYQQSISTAATQTIQIPTAFASVRGIVWGIRTVASLTTTSAAGKQYLMSSELTDLVSLDLRINSQKRQNDVFVGVNEAIAETRRLFPIAKQSDYWSSLSLNQTTHQMLGMLAGQCYPTSCISGLNSQAIQSQMYLEFTLTSNLSTASVIDIFIIHDRAITVSNSSLYIDE